MKSIELTDLSICKDIVVRLSLIDRFIKYSSEEGKEANITNFCHKGIDVLVFCPNYLVLEYQILRI